MAGSKTTTKLHAFHREDTTYASDGLSIEISIFVPKSAGKGQKLPVLVRWHGGALINGGRVYEPWFPKWYVNNGAHFQQKRLLCSRRNNIKDGPSPCACMFMLLFSKFFHEGDTKVVLLSPGSSTLQPSIMLSLSLRTTAYYLNHLVSTS